MNQAPLSTFDLYALQQQMSQQHLLVEHLTQYNRQFSVLNQMEFLMRRQLYINFLAAHALQVQQSQNQPQQDSNERVEKREPNLTSEKDRMSYLNRSDQEGQPTNESGSERGITTTNVIKIRIDQTQKNQAAHSDSEFEISDEQAFGSDKKSQPSLQKKISKNIPKNVFKGIIKYILGRKDDIKEYFKEQPEKVSGFIHYVKRHKNSVLSMQQMRKFLDSRKNEDYVRLMRIFSNQFISRDYVAYVYNSKIKCRKEHLNNRHKFQCLVKNSGV